MQFSGVLLAFVSWLARLSLTHAYSYSLFYMSSYCGSSITVRDMDPIRIDLTSRSTYRPNRNCLLRINANTGLRMLGKFRSFNVESSFSCRNDRLDIFDGPSTSFTKLTGINGLCGFSIPSKIYASTSNYLTLDFISDSTLQYRGFSLIITPFQDSCQNSSNTFRCRNKRCIKSGLTCDGWNNCGDNSDEIEGCGLSVGGIAGVVVAVIVFFIIFLTIGIVCRRRRLRYVSVGSPGYSVTQTTTTYGSPAPPPAGFAGYPNPPKYGAGGQYQPAPAGAYPQ